MTLITRPARRGPWSGGAILAVAVLAGLAGCGSGGSAQPQAGHTPDASTAAIVACFRAHGDPSFPDPVYDPNDGRWHFAVSPGSAPAATQQACQHLFPAVNPSPPVPQAQFQQLVKLAQCIRQHGVPSWPDPDLDGSFGLPPALLGKSPALVRATKACGRFMTNGSIDVHAAA